MPVGLKWPNDLVVSRPGGERKLAGILAESAWSGDRLDAVVVGMGLNVGVARAGPRRTGRASPSPSTT